MIENELDYKKLRSLGVPEEVIGKMDVCDGGNIDAQGNVLFLDTERQKHKENSEKSMWRNKSDGLGIKNAIVKKVSDTAMNQLKNGDGAYKPFELMVNMAKKPENNLGHKGVMKFLGMDQKGYTYGTVFPLNVDMSESLETTVMPIDLVMEAIEEAEFIAILDKCMCRVSYDCKDYPQDFGCMFLNRAGRRVTEVGVAHQVTTEEAKKHIFRAKELGLLANSEFLQGEQYIWGIPNSNMHEFRMFCFCCPCCCLMLKLINAGTPEEKKRMTSCGYTATVNHDKCTACHKCAEICVQDAISYRKDGKSVIDQDKCMGCGYCKLDCESGAISIKQTFPMRTSANEYFLKEGRIDDGYDHKK